MKPATSTRAPRPPVARTDPNRTVPNSGGAAPAGAATSDGAADAAAPSTAVVSETQLRRRLAQVEMRLRDMDEEAKRARVLQEQELAKVERDNVRLREQLERLRMGECMSPAEARALMTHLQHQQTAGAPAGRAESKLLSSTGLKYQSAKAEVEERRRECVQDEQRFATARARLVELRGARREVKRRSRAFEVPAALRAATADTYRAHIHEQLRGLEEQVGREQERFSEMANTAKQVRLSIDALLINQTGNEKLYRERYDALLTKRREIAYLMEVCNLLCEERQAVVAELQHMKLNMAEENHRYEAAFEELSGVLDENAKAQGANRTKLEELRRLIAQTRGEREALEGDNAAAKAAIDRQRRRTTARRTRDDSSVAGSSAYNDKSGTTDVRVDESGEQSRPASGGSADGNQQQIRVLDDYYHRLANIVQSDAIEDVIGFMDAAADERYKSFDEMNAIKRDMATLEAERAALEVELSGGISATAAAAAAARAASYVSAAASVTGGGDATPRDGTGVAALPLTSTSALAALAGAHTLEALTAVTASVAKSGAGSVVPGAAVSQERSARMAGLLDDLGCTRDRVFEEEESQEAGAAVLAQVVAQVREAFCGLGCSVDELRAITGLSGVQLSTLLPCLALVEQRTSEYLLAFAREQQRQQHRLQQQQLFLHASGEWSEAHANAAAAASAASATSRNAARSILRRPDLLPRVPHGAVSAVITRQTLPRTTDIAAGVPALCIDNGAGATTTVEDLVEERPLSEAEMKQIVEAKRALARA